MQPINMGAHYRALFLDLVGGMVLHPRDDAARQVVQLLKQGTVGIAAVHDVAPTRLHQTRYSASSEALPAVTVTPTGIWRRTSKATCIFAARCWSSCHSAHVILGRAGKRLPSTSIRVRSAARSVATTRGRQTVAQLPE